MNSPNYPPPGGPQGPYGPPPGSPPPPYGQRPPQTPPGGQPYGGPPPQGPPMGQPYGGPPPQGQPYGGPSVQTGGGFGPGGPGGPPPPAAYPPPPPPAPTSKPSNVGKFIKLGVAVVVLGVAAFFVIKQWGTSASSAEVGDCIKVNEASISSADVEKVECNDPAATYKVGATFDAASDNCPDKDNSGYVSYTQTSNRGDGMLLCLILNAKVGDCYEQGTSVDTKLECTDPKATFQVAELVNSVDESACPEGTAGTYVYPEPKPGLVQCLVEPGGGATTG